MTVRTPSFGSHVDGMSKIHLRSPSGAWQALKCRWMPPFRMGMPPLRLVVCADSTCRHDAPTKCSRRAVFSANT